MKDVNVILADLPGLGRVRMCECNSIHVSIGPVTLNLEPAAFLQMTTLMCGAMEQLTAIRKAHDAEARVLEMQGQPQSRMTH
jgi:hypothetical protein